MSYDSAVNDAGAAMQPDEVTNRSELAAALTNVRAGAGFTIRDLAKRLGTPAGTLGDYFGGRHLPSLAQLPLLRSALAECGITDQDEIERWVAAVQRVRAASDRRVSRLPAPYRGLNSFQPEDADLFFGRSTETHQILQLLSELRRDPGPSAGILAVVGPSGSGKSSLLRAGVVAAIRGGALDGPDEKWTCALTTPGSDPIGALAEVRGTPADTPRVVVIDQFEETFTLVEDPDERSRFLQSLGERDNDTLLVLGMRADFYAEAAREPSLLPALQDSQVLVGPMSHDGVREAILRPAERIGISVEKGLVDLILADLAPHDAAGRAHDAGALPLMSHALLVTWERSTGRRLTIADYRSAGGIDAAIQRTAEELYTSLDPSEQDIARRLFVRMVNIEDDVAVTRRRLGGDELRQLTDDEVTARHIVDRFVERRLVTAHATSAEVSHEALLSAWPRLKSWIDADRAALRLNRQITDAANAWRDADRDEAMLLRGARLEAATELAADRDRWTHFNQLERDFLDASTAAASAERARARRRIRRLRQLLAALAVLAVVAAGLAAYSLRARSDADHARRTATTSRDDALSRQIAVESRELRQNDAALAQQLALVAYQRAHTDEARGALIDQSSEPAITRILGVQGPTALAVSPDGRLIAVGHADDGSVHLYSAHSGSVPRPIATIPGDRGTSHQVFALAFSTDSRLLASGGESPILHLWNVIDAARPRSASALKPGFTGAIQSMAFSPDGRTLAAASLGSHPVAEWHVRLPSSPRRLGNPRGEPANITAMSVAFSPDGSALAAAGADGTVRTWPAASAATTLPHTARLRANGVNAVRFAADGKHLFTGDSAGNVDVFSTPSLTLEHHVPSVSTAQVNVLAAAPDGSQLAVGSSDNTVHQLSTGSWTQVASAGQPGPVTGAAYSPDSKTLITTAADGTLRLKPASVGLPTDGPAYNLGYSASGSRLAIATGGEGPGIRIWDTSRHEPHRMSPLITSTDSADPLSGTVAIRPDGNLVAGGTLGGQLLLWDVTQPSRPHPVTEAVPALRPGSIVESMAFNGAGTLLAIGGDDNTIRLFDVRRPGTPHELARVHGRSLMFNLTFSADGKLLAAANADKHAYLWDISTATRPVLRARLGGFKSYVYGVAISPDGRRLAASSADHTTRLWDIHDPSRPSPLSQSLIGPTDYVYTVAFSPRGNLLAVASNDHTVRIYDVDRRPSRVPLATLGAVDASAFIVAFSPDGRHLVAGGRSTTAPLWTIDAATYARELCPLVGDPITRDEWALYVPGVPYAPPCRK